MCYVCTFVEGLSKTRSSLIHFRFTPLHARINLDAVELHMLSKFTLFHWQAFDIISHRTLEDQTVNACLPVPAWTRCGGREMFCIVPEVFSATLTSVDDFSVTCVWSNTEKFCLAFGGSVLELTADLHTFRNICDLARDKQRKYETARTVIPIMKQLLLFPRTWMV